MRELESRAIFGGLALTPPLIVNPLPSWAALLLAAPLLIDIVRHGLTFAGYRRALPILLVISLIAALHLAFLSTSDFSASILSSLKWTAYSICIFLVISHTRNARGVAFGLFIGLSAYGICAGTLGIVKYLLHIRGVILEPILDACGGTYQAGSTICGGNNVFAASLIASAIASSILILTQPRAYRTLSFALAVTIVCGLFLGSRRFLILTVLIPTVWLTHAIITRHHDIAKRMLLPALMTTVLLLVSMYPVAHRHGDEMTIVGFGIDGLRFTPSDTMDSSKFVLARVSPDVTATALDADAVNPRSTRWRMAFDMLASQHFVFGQGFRYQKVFSCAFAKCEYLDYPHSPILSAWVAFGALGLVLIISFYFWIVFYIYKNGRNGILSGTTFVALAAVPFSLISGDTLLSSQMMIVSALLVALPHEPLISTLCKP